MDQEHTEGNFGGQITTGIEQYTLVLRTISFVRRKLPAWRDDPDRPAEQAEDKLNLQLCKFLDSSARNDFPMVRFDHEEYQSDNRRIDLSASTVESTIIGASLHTIYDPILVFECKRLPAPSQNREKEYVTGGEKSISGGIQRFKLGLHGANLNLAAMIAYVQERSASDWHHEINGWISALCSGVMRDGCVWNEGETLEALEEDVSEGVTNCRSVHRRTGSRSSSEIEIHHLWIIMNVRHMLNAYE